MAHQMSRLIELHREGLISVPHRAEKLERAPFKVVYAGNNQRPTMEAITRQARFLEPSPQPALEPCFFIFDIRLVRH